MKNKLKPILFLMFLIPSNIFATEYIVCGNDKYIPFALANVFSIIMTVIRIIIPILIVIMGMISYLKTVMSGKPEDDFKKSLKQLINSIIAAAVIFLIVSIINFVVGISAGKDNSASSCLSCMVNPDRCQKVEKKENICPGLIGQEYDENCNAISDPHKKEKEEDINKDNYVNNNNSTNNTTNSSNNSSNNQGTYVPSNYNTVEYSDSSKKYCCEVAGGGIYSNGECTNLQNDNAHTFCLNSGGNDSVIEKKKESCCLIANGKYKDNECKPYEITSAQWSAYNTCVASTGDTKSCCSSTTDGKYVNGECKAQSFNQSAYNSCVK